MVGLKKILSARYGSYICEQNVYILMGKYFSMSLEQHIIVFSAFYTFFVFFPFLPFTRPLQISLISRGKRENKWYDELIVCAGGAVMTYGFILHFRTRDKLNSVYEQLQKKKLNLVKLRKFFNPDNAMYPFILIIECGEQDMAGLLENYFVGFNWDDVDISLLQGNESEIDKMKPI